jgi:hypothetical protein
MSKNRDTEIKATDVGDFGAVVAAKASGPKKTVERWATEKGFLPAMFQDAAAHPRAIPPAPRPNPETWRFNGARAGSKWPEGAEVTESEFDAAIETATHGAIR